jgi:hypothetical protein
MDKMNEIQKLWEQLKSTYGGRQTGEIYNQLCDRLPRRLPKNADVELPESGSALVPAEKLREIFPEFSWLIDQGWKVFVTQDGCLVWGGTRCTCVQPAGKRRSWLLRASSLFRTGMPWSPISYVAPRVATSGGMSGRCNPAKVASPKPRQGKAW